MVAEGEMSACGAKGEGGDETGRERRLSSPVRWESTSLSSVASPGSSELAQTHPMIILALPVSSQRSLLDERAQDKGENDCFGSSSSQRELSQLERAHFLPSALHVPTIPTRNSLDSQDLGFSPCCSISSSVLLPWITVEETCPDVEGMSWVLIQREFERRQGWHVERRSRRKGGLHQRRVLPEGKGAKGRGWEFEDEEQREAREGLERTRSDRQASFIVSRSLLFLLSSNRDYGS